MVKWPVFLVLAYNLGICVLKAGVELLVPHASFSGISQGCYQFFVASNLASRFVLVIVEILSWVSHGRFGGQFTIC
jgi:hypothetical protein